MSRKEGRFYVKYVSASTKALFVPSDPPSGLKFPFNCSVQSYRASDRMGTLTGCKAWYLHPIWNHVHTSCLLWYQGDSGDHEENLVSRCVKWDAEIKQCMSLSFPSRHILEVHGAPSLVQGKESGQAWSLTWESTPRLALPCTAGLLAHWCSESHRSGSQL